MAYSMAAAKGLAGSMAPGQGDSRIMSSLGVGELASGDEASTTLKCVFLATGVICIKLSLSSGMGEDETGTGGDLIKAGKISAVAKTTEVVV